MHTENIKRRSNTNLLTTKKALLLNMISYRLSSQMRHICNLTPDFEKSKNRKTAIKKNKNECNFNVYYNKKNVLLYSLRDGETSTFIFHS